MNDMLLKNATIVDGTGAEGYLGDVLVNEGKIVKIGTNLQDSAKEVYDLQGYLLTPGFVDIHRHGDVYAINGKLGEVELRQGLTTIVNGNCGFSLAPCTEKDGKKYYQYLKSLTGTPDGDLYFPTLKEYIDKVNSVPQRINVGTLVGNGTIRVATMGYENRPMNDAEVEKAKSLIDEAMQAGACGISLGMIYVPETFTTTEEYRKIFANLKKYNTVITSHVRGEGDLLQSSLKEVIEISKIADTRLHISHFKSSGKPNWGEGMRAAMQQMIDAKKAGNDVTCDVYPYHAASTTLFALIPNQFQSGGIDATVERLKDPEIRKQITEILSKRIPNTDNLVFNDGWGAVIIASCASENKDVIGKSVEQIAKERGINPYDCAYDLLVEEKGVITMLYYCMSEQDVEMALKWENSSIISDALYAEGSMPHPRMYGTYVRVLEEFVKNKKVLTLPQAIHKITQKPCGILNLKTKGVIKEGYDADICVFRLEDIHDNSTYFDPCKCGSGFKMVIVGGQVASENDVLKDVFNGKFVRANNG